MRFLAVIFMALLVAFGAVGGFTQPAVAQDSTTWEGDSGESWYEEKWSNGVPTASLEAIINNGTVPHVPPNANAAVCKKLTIANAENFTGTSLTIKAGGRLIVGDGTSATSVLDAEDNVLTIEGGTVDPELDGGKLLISGVQTFTGAGSIVLELYDGTRTSLIAEATDDEDRLILGSDCGFSPIEQSCSIRLIGQGDVQVALDNRAFVISNDGNYNSGVGLHLSTRQKITDDEAEGYWIAQADSILWVDTLVTGPGEWHVTDPACQGAIIVGHGGNDGCVVGSGKVILNTGCGGLSGHTLKVENNTFSTTGRLVGESVYSDDEGKWTRPTIAAPGGTAMFGLSAEPDPANVCGGN
ncbi:MAG: hypothetical protein C4547_13590 [Phycisphaerales bacterium]|nr:MAG: hypothetical protein C4547_13590 [Phycisphaerales bacterium]